MSMEIGGWKVSKDFARAIGKFKPEGIDGYKAATMPDTPLRKTREEAMKDEALYRIWLHEASQ